ncbi:MAG TPA: sugar phosphate isomerase/epimerase [Gemmatimonadaceae bacterium]|nr:sugar phosphate isomerase/epimerase [Gemmatimonadaceae bacterium]
MKRREFVQTLGGVAAGAALGQRVGFPMRKLDRVGLELYAVRHAMQKDPERTLAAVAAMGYKDVELLWSFGNFGRTTAQVKQALANTGLRAPSAHIDPISLFIGWERSLDTAKAIGHDYLIVPSFTGATSQTLDDWREWADRFNAAGAVARRHDIWLGFHNEADHMPLIDGQVPYDVFVQRLDPSVTRLQLDVGNMLIGGGDPMAYLEKYKDRYWSFHLKDVLPDRKGDTYLGAGIFDFKRFLAAVPNLDQKPAYVEHESPADELDAARRNIGYLKNLDF